MRQTDTRTSGLRSSRGLKSALQSFLGRLKASGQQQVIATQVAATATERKSWSTMAKRLQETEIRFSEQAPAHQVVLTNAEGAPVRLDQLAGLSTTMVLLISDNMRLLPGIAHRIARRAETLGQGVRLVCVTERSTPGLSGAFVDSSRQIHALSGGHGAPVLVSLDARGMVFDVISDSNAIMDWLWNDPRPHSLRAHASISLGEYTA
jgi:RNase P/RNase MRP subunit p29